MISIGPSGRCCDANDRSVLASRTLRLRVAMTTETSITSHSYGFGTIVESLVGPPGPAVR